MTFCVEQRILDRRSNTFSSNFGVVFFGEDQQFGNGNNTIVLLFGDEVVPSLSKPRNVCKEICQIVVVCILIERSIEALDEAIHKTVHRLRRLECFIVVFHLDVKDCSYVVVFSQIYQQNAHQVSIGILHICNRRHQKFQVIHIFHYERPHLDVIT